MVRPEAVSRHRATFGEVFVLFVGRLVYYKGLDVLLRASSGLGWPIVIAGDGPKRASLEALANELGVRTRVHFLGHVPDEELRALVLASRLVVLPSTGVGEAFGQSLVEAALMGRPAVATTLPTGVPWVNLDGVTGFNVEPGDDKALAAAIREICENDSLSSRLGASARERALSEFTTDRMVERTLDLYGSVLGAASAGRSARARD
jgi:rhamnosyl/mannosyltransferase